MSRHALRTVKAVCPHDCPDTCAWIVTVEDGRAVRMIGSMKVVSIRCRARVKFQAGSLTGGLPMRTKFKWAGVIIGLVVVGLQFTSPRHTNPSFDEAQTLQGMTTVPSEVSARFAPFLQRLP